jgi:hypothetical protein
MPAAPESDGRLDDASAGPIPSAIARDVQVTLRQMPPEWDQ